MMKDSQEAHFRPLERALQIVCLPTPRTGPVALLIALPGTRTRALAALLWRQSRAQGPVLQMLPPRRMAPPDLLAWHDDAWRALDRGVRSSATLLVGPTAGCMAAVLGDEGQCFAPVADPLEVPAAVGLTPRQIRKQLRESAKDLKREFVPVLSNPQARVLLEKVRAPDDLPVTRGSAAAPDEWRARLNDAVADARLVGPGEMKALAAELAPRIGAAPKRTTQAAQRLALLRTEATADISATAARRLRTLNWLDLELFERATGDGERG